VKGRKEERIHPWKECRDVPLFTSKPEPVQEPRFLNSGLHSFLQRPLAEKDKIEALVPRCQNGRYLYKSAVVLLRSKTPQMAEDSGPCGKV